MSRLQNARVRALKATAGDLEEIANISGLSKQERFHLHEARRICLALMEKPIGNQVGRGPAAQGPGAKPVPAEQGQAPTHANGTPQGVAQQRDEEAAAALRRAFPNHGKPWDSGHLEHLKATVRQAVTDNLDMDALSRQFGRSHYSVALKAVSMGYRSPEWAEQYRINPGHGAGAGQDAQGAR